MAQLKCEYPCRLDLWAKVIKAKNIQRDEQIVFDLVNGQKVPKQLCIAPPEECGGPVTPIVCVEDIKVRNLSTSETFICNNKVEVKIEGDLVMILRTEFPPGEECFFIHVEPFAFQKTIKLQEFSPPLTPQEFLQEVDQSEVVVKNIRFDWDINGPCYDPYGNVIGTIISLSVFADIIDKLAKWQDVVVFGELDPEDC